MTIEVQFERRVLERVWHGTPLSADVPAYRPTETLVPAPLKVRVSFGLVERASDWRYRLPARPGGSL